MQILLTMFDSPPEHFFDMSISGLLSKLDALKTDDLRFVHDGLYEATRIANEADFEKDGIVEGKAHRRLGHALGQISGEEANLWFELLVGLLLSKDADLALKRMNPYIKSRADVLNITAGVISRANRAALIGLCQSNAKGLLSHLKKVRVFSFKSIVSCAFGFCLLISFPPFTFHYSRLFACTVHVFCRLSRNQRRRSRRIRTFKPRSSSSRKR